MSITNRVTELLGVEHRIVEAPMGWIARSQLASAVSNAGGLGIIETSSGELDVVKEEIRKMRDLTDKPFGVNIAHAFVRPGDRRVRHRRGHRLRHHVGGRPDGAHRAPEVSGLTVTAAKQRVSIPVLAVGGIRTADEVDGILDRDQVDMVGIGRPFYAEAGLAARILAGDPAPALCRNSNACASAQMLGMKGACYNPEVVRLRRRTS